MKMLNQITYTIWNPSYEMHEAQQFETIRGRRLTDKEAQRLIENEVSPEATVTSISTHIIA